jgi:hypothetical protein
MTASAVGYERVQESRPWEGKTHATVMRPIPGAVLCVLLTQRVMPVALARALPIEQGGRARARLPRGRCWWIGPPLDQVIVSSQLTQVVFVPLPPGQSVVVALDTTRLGAWEVWGAGSVVAGHTVPSG